jgi:hypothetical protein
VRAAGCCCRAAQRRHGARPGRPRGAAPMPGPARQAMPVHRGTSPPSAASLAPPTGRPRQSLRPRNRCATPSSPGVPPHSGARRHGARRAAVRARPRARAGIAPVPHVRRGLRPRGAQRRALRCSPRPPATRGLPGRTPSRRSSWGTTGLSSPCCAAPPARPASHWASHPWAASAARRWDGPPGTRGARPTATSTAGCPLAPGPRTAPPGGPPRRASSARCGPGVWAAAPRASRPAPRPPPQRRGAWLQRRLGTGPPPAAPRCSTSAMARRGESRPSDRAPDQPRGARTGDARATAARWPRSAAWRGARAACAARIASGAKAIRGSP